jgi:hypothetical protein
MIIAEGCVGIVTSMSGISGIGPKLGHQLFKIIFLLFSSNVEGTRLRSWLRHCATNIKVAGSIPEGITGIIH